MNKDLRARIIQLRQMGEYLTIGALRQVLADLPPDILIIMSKDAEGNLYSPLRCAETAIYIPNSTHSGDVYLEEDLDTEALSVADGEWVLALRPVN